MFKRMEPRRLELLTPCMPCRINKHYAASSVHVLGRAWKPNWYKSWYKIAAVIFVFTNHPSGGITATACSSTNLFKHAFADWSRRRWIPISFCSIAEMRPRSTCITIGFNLPDISIGRPMLKKDWWDNPYRCATVLIANHIYPTSHISCFCRKMSANWQGYQA